MKHVYNPNFDSAEGLQTALQAIGSFSEERLMAALSGKRNVTESMILDMDAQVVAVTAALTSELSKLSAFAEDFNRKFVTRNNDRYSAAHALLNKISKGVSGFKNVFLQFTPNRRPSALPQSDERPSIYRNSVIGEAEYTPVLFPGLYPESVHRLYEDIRSLFERMEEGIRMCQDVLARESEIRASAPQCVGLYHDFLDDHYPHIKALIKNVNLETDEYLPENNKAIRLRKGTGSLEEFSQQGFHALPFDDMCTMATKVIVEKEREDEIEKELLMLMRYDREKALCVREIIKDFERYLPVKPTRKSIPADYIAYLLRWAEPKEDLAFVNYFTQTYAANGGTLKVPKNCSVNQRKQMITGEEDEYLSAKSAWDALFAEISKKTA